MPYTAPRGLTAALQTALDAAYEAGYNDAIKEIVARLPSGLRGPSAASSPSKPAEKKAREALGTISDLIIGVLTDGTPRSREDIFQQAQRCSPSVTRSSISGMVYYLHRKGTLHKNNDGLYQLPPPAKQD